MNEISLRRLYALRLAYLIFAGGLIAVKWPTLISHPATWPLFEGVSSSLFGALALLALLGLRYPLQMLPILFLELTWKIIWLVLVWLPLWRSSQIDEATATVAVNCLVVIIFIPLIPWDYVFARYVRAAGAPWLRKTRYF